jgi:signal transduction histidine kinase
MRRGTLSLRGRVILACLLTLAIGAAVPIPLAALIKRLWSSYTWPSFTAETFCLTPGGQLCPPAFDPFTRNVITAGLVVGLIAVALLVRYVARRALQPIATMTDTVRQMGPQNLGQRIGWTGHGDELRDLADSVDNMLDRVAVGFESQRRFAANASHELRTPLAVQRTLVEVAITTSDGADPELNRLGAQLLAVNERNERLIEGLLVLAESDRGLVGTGEVRLDELVTDTLAAYAELAAEHGVGLRRGLVARTVDGDRVLLERLVSNLLHNAIKYNNPGGWVEVVVAETPTIAIHNSGEHVPAEAIQSLFEPFRRLSADRTNHRGGAGLGLSIVRSIVLAHGGTVTAEPGAEGGLRINVNLPRLT